jgi:hypothetical protein
MALTLCIDDILAVSPSGRPSEKEPWATQSEGPQDRLLWEIIHSFTKQQCASSFPPWQGWDKSIPTGEIESATLSSYHNEAKACAQSYQDFIQGAIAASHQLHFNDYLNAILENGVPNSSRIISRLQNLLEMAKDDELGNPMPINIDSLGSMTKFLISSCIQRYPDIALSRDGMCFVEWYTSPYQSLSLLFLSDGTARALWTNQPDKTVPRSDHTIATRNMDNMITFLKRVEALPE